MPLILFLRERKDRIEADRGRDLAEAERHATIQRLQERELRRLEEQAARKEKLRTEEQARCVSVWFEPGFDDGVSLSTSSRTIKVSNASQGMISFVDMTFVLGFGDEAQDGTGGQEAYAILSVEYLPPTGMTPLELPVSEATLKGPFVPDFPLPHPSAPLETIVLWKMEFRDAAGRHWIKDHAEELTLDED